MGKVIFLNCCKKEKFSLVQATFKILKTVFLEILKKLVPYSQRLIVLIFGKGNLD